jgi:hypothetical protein
MGYDIIVSFSIDQDDIEKFIVDNKLDRNDWIFLRGDQSPVVQYFLDKYIEDPTDKEFLLQRRVYYDWHEDMNIHQITASHHSSFIRDDERLDSRYYQKLLEKKVGKPFPHILQNMNFYIRTPEDADEAADAILDFFPDDPSLMGFREWLLITSKYAVCYELSW